MVLLLGPAGIDQVILYGHEPRELTVQAIHVHYNRIL